MGSFGGQSTGISTLIKKPGSTENMGNETETTKLNYFNHKEKAGERLRNIF